MSTFVNQIAIKIVDYLLDNDPPKDFRDAMLKRVEDSLLVFGLAVMHDSDIQRGLMDMVNEGVEE